MAKTKYIIKYLSKFPSSGKIILQTEICYGKAQFEKTMSWIDYLRMSGGGKLVEIKKEEATPIKKEKIVVAPNTPQKDLIYSVVTISFNNYSKTYDYLLINKSGQPVTKNQRINIITGSRENQAIYIKHYNKYPKIPDHVTKSLILTSTREGFFKSLNTDDKPTEPKPVQLKLNFGEVDGD